MAEDKPQHHAVDTGAPSARPIDSAKRPPHGAVEGPEEVLEPAREQAHASAEAAPPAPPAQPAKAEAPPPAAPTQPAKAEAPKAEAAKPQADAAKLASLEAREKELVDRLARLQADFENFRRRAREESAQAASKGKLEFVKALLPVLDNLDRALAHSQDEGLKLLSRQLQNVLSSSGLLILDPTGEAFDAKVHEAIAQESKEGVKAGTVLTTVEKGYALEGKVVRPARVVVAA